MRFRKALLKITVLTITISMISGCSSSGEVNKSAGSSSGGADKTAGSGSAGKPAGTDNGGSELSITYYQNSERIVEAAISKYLSENPSVSIKREKVSRKEEYSDTMKELDSLMTRTLAGEGPDIIIELNYFRVAKNYKTLNSGVYCDLNELIKNDAEFSLDDYYQNVMDTGIINSKRYVMPLAFEVCGFLTTKETLEENNVDIDKSSWDWKYFIQITRDFIQRNKGKDKYFLNPMFDYNVLQYYTASRVDYTKNKSDFNSEEFKTVLKDLKEIYSAIYPIKKDNGWSYSPVTYVRDRKAVLSFDTSGMSSMTELSGMYDNFKKEINQELIVLPFPLIDENKGYPFSVSITAGITSTCRYKKEAFELIKTMLMPEIIGDLFYSRFGLPVSKAGYKKVTSEPFPFQYGGGYPHPEAALLEIDKMVENLGKGVFYDQQINSIVYGHYADYRDGRATLEETVKKMDDDTYFYLNE
ncbi:MAG: extracellular solute-binding protein [Clostridiaceae bacterium]